MTIVECPICKQKVDLDLKTTETEKLWNRFEGQMSSLQYTVHGCANCPRPRKVGNGGIRI